MPLGPDRAAPALDSPQAVLDAVVRLRGGGEGRVAFWWLTETVYGVVGDRITPLHRGQVGTLIRTARNVDGTYDLTQLETVFWTALDGITELKALKNPYTGADNAMTPSIMGPHTVRLTTNGTEAPKDTRGGKTAFTSTLGPVVAVGGDVFISSDVMARVTFDDPALKPRTVNDLSTYQGRASDLADSSRNFIPAWVTFQGIASWPPSMNMGDREGHLVARAAGAKVASLDRMPEIWRRFAERDLAHILKDPAAALERPAERLG